MAPRLAADRRQRLPCVVCGQSGSGQTGIGLQPDAFADFHFRLTDWPYNKAWADEVLAWQQAASALVRAGKDAEALPLYTALAARR